MALLGEIMASMANPAFMKRVKDPHFTEAMRVFGEPVERQGMSVLDDAATWWDEAGRVGAMTDWLKERGSEFGETLPRFLSEEHPYPMSPGVADVPPDATAAMFGPYGEAWDRFDDTNVPMMMFGKSFSPKGMVNATALNAEDMPVNWLNGPSFIEDAPWLMAPASAARPGGPLWMGKNIRVFRPNLFLENPRLGLGPTWE